MSRPARHWLGPKGSGASSPELTEWPSPSAAGQPQSCRSRRPAWRSRRAGNRTALLHLGQHERLVPPPLGVWTTATTSSAVRVTLALGDELPAREGDLRERLAQGQQSEDYQVVRPSDPRRFEDLAALAVVARHGGGRAIIAL